MQERARILIVDDHPLVIEGLSALIGASEGMLVCGSARSAAEAMAIVAGLQPDVMLVDLSMDGGGGLELIRQIHALHPRIALLVVSMHEEETYGPASLRAGAMGYVNKRAAATHVIRAIRSLLEGRPFFALAQSAQRSALDALSPRETQVFELIAQGLTTTAIAAALTRSVKTIETHREHIKEKLGLESSHALTVYALQLLRER